jgi:hypothetical protein
MGRQSPDEADRKSVGENDSRPKYVYTKAFLGFGFEPQPTQVTGDMMSNGLIRCSLTVEIRNEETYDLKAHCTVLEKSGIEIDFSQECEKGPRALQDRMNIVDVKTATNFQTIILECKSYEVGITP